MKRVISLLLAACMAFSLAAPAWAEGSAANSEPLDEPEAQTEDLASTNSWITISRSGTCGPALDWALADGTLTISGAGLMDFSGNAPWYRARKDIQHVVIESGATSIEGGAFSDCVNLLDISIPNTVAEIDAFAFSNCSSLTAIDIPSSVSFIGNRAFLGCTSLTSLTIPGKIGAKLQSSMFSGYTNLTKIVLMDGITTISGAFSGCTALTELTIPASVTSIASGAFATCTDLSKIHYGGTQEQWDALLADSAEDVNAQLSRATVDFIDNSTLVAPAEDGSESAEEAQTSSFTTFRLILDILQNPLTYIMHYLLTRS